MYEDDVRSSRALADAAGGGRELDLAIVGGMLLDVYRGRWLRGDLGIYRGRVASFGGHGLTAREVIDAAGKWVVPGFFESHYHAGGTHLSPRRLAEEFLRRGTTSSVCDFQEFYVVGGRDAAREAIDESRAAGLRLFYLLPTQHFVLNALAHPQRHMPIEDMTAMLDWPETVAINEPPPGPVMNDESDILSIVSATFAKGKMFAGHAPSMTGPELQAYISTGASSDHESRSAEEAWQKLALGMRVMMRHGSAAPDMEQLIELAREHPLASRYMMLVSDEIDPNDLIDVGHLDEKLRRAIAAGVDPVVALQMVTINPAEYYRIDHQIGSLAPGRFADAVILDDLESVSISAVVSQGVPVAAERARREPVGNARLGHPLTFGRPVSAEDFVVPATGASARVRAIAIEEGSLLSQCQVVPVPVVAGNARPDAEQDIAKLAIVERTAAPDFRATGFTRGFGLRSGAVATTYAHSFYNLLVVGTDEALMAVAANTLAELGGGVVVVDGDGRVIHTWELPLVGIFSDENIERVREDFNRTNQAIRELGCPFASPLLALSFVALPTIPELGMTHAGLYDVSAQRFVDVVVAASEP
ncbi:MAG: adenine deaminase [Microbacteriaceae bacterium]|nr:MAG: adenine deaminase [Microbacteriaceae bacterium]